MRHLSEHIEHHTHTCLIRPQGRVIGEHLDVELGHKQVCDSWYMEYEQVRP